VRARPPAPAPGPGPAAPRPPGHPPPGPPRPAEPLPEDLDPKVAKEREKERADAAKEREKALKAGLDELGIEGREEGLETLSRAVRSVVEARSPTAGGLAEKGPGGRGVGCLRALVGHPSASVRLEGCRLLRALCRTGAGARAVLKAELVAPVAAIAADGAAPEALRSAAMHTLRQAAEASGAILVDVLDQGAVRPLLELLASPDAPDRLRADAAGLLSLLASRSVSCVSQLWDLGAVPVLRALLPRVPGVEFDPAAAAAEEAEAAEGKDGKGRAPPRPPAKAAAGAGAEGPGEGGEGGPGRVAVPAAPSRSSEVHRGCAEILSSVARLPVLRQRILADERAAVLEWEERADEAERAAEAAAAAGGEGEGERGAAAGSEEGGAAAPGPPFVPRQATTAEAMFYLLSEPDPEPEPAPEPEPEDDAPPADAKGGKAAPAEPEPAEYPDLGDPLRAPFPTGVRMAAAECLQSMVLEHRCARELLHHPGFRRLVASLATAENDLLGQRMLKVASVMLCHVKPKVMEELGLSRSVMELAHNFADTRLMLLRNTIGRTTMAIRPEYPTRPPLPSAPPSPPSAPEVPQSSLWDTLAQLHLDSGVAQHT